jgi:predicted Fe-S protein YdhL (DUF1289 family)
MHQPISTVESPCINICKLNTGGEYCLGCYRTLDDLSRWSKADDREKQQILDLARGRMEKMAAKG